MGTDSLYYIMDYSGNYYRTNQTDQLTIAASEKDATVFTFAQANSRIGVGKRAAFYCVVPVDNEEGASEEYVSPVKELTYDEITEQVERSASSYDLAEMDWTEYLTHFSYILEGIKGYRDDLNKRLSDIDQKICDILHYIELCETDDKEAVDLVELLRVCRENRRDIKDELQKTEYFQKNLGTNANAEKAKLALKSIKGLETRKYKPRKFDELFENCIPKGKRLQKEELYEAEYSDEIKKKNFTVKHVHENESGEEIMRQERRDTPFDGKNNDWISFARQQAEFYRNAEVYINNLQIDIKEIEDEIETILLGTEDANCNVAQGYKVFKRLKELRLARKEKAKELDCLHALTDYIDCNALADTCEDNLTEVEGIMELSEKKEVVSIQPVNMQQEIPVEDNIEDMAG